ncbi:hypothetical protein DSM104299_02210 [Baekduia alba]|uniref:phage tail protein n=1 Tax=Baekduia alba TaxID=2997333 RepID=UPI0023406962|nr:phage tail protein [Baekduia alba]WCB93497.1 hypothetical protein DSM104299_02210 [Baekduia alba]
MIGERTAASVAAPRPRSASARRLMVEALPPIYRDVPAGGGAPLVERWLGGLEEVLDPVVALLDNLPAHLDPELAPDDLVDLLCGWVGMPLGPALALDAKRRLLAHSAEIADTRGTLRGLDLVLGLAFPDLGLTATHTGAVTTGADPAVSPDAPAPEIVVRSAAPLGSEQRLALLELLEDQRPAHVPCRVVDGPEAATP